MFEGTKKASWELIVAVLIVHTVLTVWINLYGFRAGLLDVWLFGGLINSTLAANLLLLAVVVVGLLFGLGRLRLGDVGLYRRQIATALLGGLVVWTIFQLVALVMALMSGTMSINSLWRDEGSAAAAGYLVAQLFGNSLYEEIVFRGFLFVQLLLHFSSRFSRRWVSLTSALVLSQAIFALSHVPNRLFVGEYTLSDTLYNQLPLFIFGLLFAFVYLRTRNLLLVVVIHALGNEPTAIVAASDTVFDITLLLLMVASILFWPRAQPKLSLAAQT